MTAIRSSAVIALPIVVLASSFAAAQQPKAAAAAPAADAGATLLGQYGDWGAYTASPGGHKVCFALAKPKATKTERSAESAILLTCSSPPARART